MKNLLFSCRPAAPSVLSAFSKLFRGTQGIVSLTVSSLILLALALSSGAAQAQSCAGYTDQPLVSVPSGDYTVAQMVTLSDAQPGAVIYYTTNGENAWSNMTTPNPNAKVYSAPFEVSTTTNLSVIALAPGYCINYYIAGSNIVFKTPAQDFAISVSPATLNVDVGKSATATLTVTPTNGFDYQIGFSCSGASQVVCDFTPLLVTPSGGSTNVQLTVLGVGLPTVAARHQNSKPFLPATALAGILCIFGLRKRRGPRLMMVAMVAFASLGLLSACGGGSGPTPVAPGTVTVTATMANVAVSTLQHTTTFSVN